MILLLNLVVQIVTHKIANIFGKKATVLKKLWESSCNKKILISRIPFFFFFFFSLANIGHDLAFRNIWLIVLFFLLSWIQKESLLLLKPCMCWWRIPYPKPIQLPFLDPVKQILPAWNLFWFFFCLVFCKLTVSLRRSMRFMFQNYLTNGLRSSFIPPSGSLTGFSRADFL